MDGAGRPNRPFYGDNNVQARSRFNGRNDVLDGLSDLSFSDRAGRYFNYGPQRFNFYSPPDDARLSNDNPLYEIDDDGMFGFSEENDMSTNPLYGDELYSDQAMDLGSFLRPRDPRLQNNISNTSESPEREPMEGDQLVQSWIRSPESPATDLGPTQGVSPGNGFRHRPPVENRNNLPQGQNPHPSAITLAHGNPSPIDTGFLQEGTDENVSPDANLASWDAKANAPLPVTRLRVIPPARCSPVQPPCYMNRAYDFSPSPTREVRKYATMEGQLSPPIFSVPGNGKPFGALGNRGRWSCPSAAVFNQPPPVPLRRPQLTTTKFPVQNIKDLVAALRSDRTLFKAEVRKDGAREPRVPGDHDRYFAPRKGDIIVHSTPTDDFDQKLVEYFDPQKTSQRLQPGDKLVRVKYDNQRIPDHLKITSKLYVYAPDWIYLGKALQTIKTA